MTTNLETIKAQQAIEKIQSKNHRIRTIAIVSADNPMGGPTTPEDNERATQRLFHILSTGHIIYFPIKGISGGLPENSTFVFNVTLHSAKFFADDFKQERMVFVDITSPDKIIYQYWRRPAERKQLRLVEEYQDDVDTMNDSMNYIVICKKFDLYLPFLEGYMRTLTALNEYSSQSDVDRMLTEITTSGWSGWHQYVTRAKLYGKWYRLRSNNHKNN